ncbi:hypothetical protein Hanom_Chr06g00569341 [Helianthus anomalus]
MNKRSVEAVGAADYLVYIVNMSLSSLEGDKAVSILCHLRLSGTGLKALFGKNGEFAEMLTCVQRASSYKSPAFAVLLLKSMIEVAEPIQVWIAYKESSWKRAFLWIVLLVSLRGVTICVYIVRQLYGLLPQQPASLILFNNTNR